MEGGSPIVTAITYGMMAVVIGALLFLAMRSAWFFLSLLLIPAAEMLARSRRGRALVERWGVRGTADLPAYGGPATAVPGGRPPVPLAVRRGFWIGFALGALPGLAMAVRGALAEQARGASTGTVLGTVGIAIGLVAAAGALLGGALGAAAGLLVSVARERR